MASIAFICVWTKQWCQFSYNMCIFTYLIINIKPHGKKKSVKRLLFNPFWLLKCRTWILLDTARSHLHTTCLQYHIWGKCWHNLHKLFFQLRSPHTGHTDVISHAAFSARGGQLPDLFPWFWIVPSAQYGKSRSRLSQMWQASFTCFPVFGSNTDNTSCWLPLWLAEPVCHYFCFDTCYFGGLTSWCSFHPAQTKWVTAHHQTALHWLCLFF